MNSFLRRTVPAALLAGGAMMVAAGPAGAQVPLPTDGLPTGGVDSLASAPSALCDGPLAALNSLSGICEVAGEDQIQVGNGAGVLPRSGEQSAQEAEASAEMQYPVNIQLNGEEEPGCAAEGDCEVPEQPCDHCPTTTVTTEPPATTETTAPPETPETTVPEAPPSSAAPQPPAEQELPRTGSTVAPFVVAGAALVAVGAALVASRRFALGRRG
ncbi:MAG TPA: LPXTG cell wall anchor domain-containing protein [Acidimicrobiales bacterium]